MANEPAEPTDENVGARAMLGDDLQAKEDVGLPFIARDQTELPENGLVVTVALLVFLD